MANGLPTMLLMAMVVGSVMCDCQKQTVVTFNTGLTPTVPSYDDRRSAVMEAIEAHKDQADFMCLQEFWFEKDVKQVLDKVAKDFPYHYSALHGDVGVLRDSSIQTSWWLPSGWYTSPCSSWKLGKFLLCIGWHCRSAVNQRKCMQEQCQDSLYSLSQNCRSCMSAASSGAKTILKKCSNVFEEFNRVNRPGLLVLSKKPLSNVEYVNYHEGTPVVLERGYIKAQVEGKMTYVCTHLSANFSYYFEEKLSRFTSFVETQRGEILQLNRTFFGSPHVLLGDLNTGPERNERDYPVLKGEVPANYDLLTALGYQNPYMDNDGRCTYCSDENPILVESNSPYGDLAIDHVMASPKVKAEVSSAKRVFDPEQTKLSDHYGVQMDVCLP